MWSVFSRRSDASQDLADVDCGQEPVVGPLTLAAVQLGRQHDLVPAAGLGCQPVADDRLSHAFGARAPVGVRRVKEVDALLQGMVHDLVRVVRLGMRAEVHRAQADPADRSAAAAKVGVVHGANIRAGRTWRPATSLRPGRVAGPCRSTCTWTRQPASRRTGRPGRSSPAADRRTRWPRGGPRSPCTA